MLSLRVYPYFEATNCIAILIFVWGDYKFRKNKQRKNERRMSHLPNHLEKDSVIYNGQFCILSGYMLLFLSIPFSFHDIVRDRELDMLHR